MAQTNITRAVLTITTIIARPYIVVVVVVVTIIEITSPTSDLIFPECNRRKGIEIG